MYCYLLLLLLSGAESYQPAVGAEPETCSTWHYIQHDQCVCGQSVGDDGILCSNFDQKVYVKAEYCVSRVNSTGELLAGTCHYNYPRNSSLVYERIFTLLPSSPTELNNFLCHPYNRKGLFCEECMDGYGPAIYAFKYIYMCADCSKLSTPVALVLYLVLELVPLTVLFFMIMVFRVNITSGPFIGYIIFCQMYIQIGSSRVPLVQSFLMSLPKVPARMLYYLLSTLSAIWSLDFFKGVIPYFCIGNKITDLYALWFDYIQVLYSIILVLFTYMCIELHSQNNRLIVFFWKPLLHPCIRIRRNWSNGSIIHAYATLLILMFLKLNCLFYNLNRQTTLYNMTEHRMSVLVAKPTIRQFDSEHIPSFLVSSAMLFVFGLLPALFLCLYPTQLFRKAAMHCCNSRKRLAMSVFADTFQGCYKDGLNGTRDCRKLPAIFMLLILAMTVISSFVEVYQTLFYRISFISIVIALTVVSYIKPCKKPIMNLSLSFHCAMLYVVTLAFSIWDDDNYSYFHVTSFAYLTLVVLATPHVLIMLWGGYRLFHFVKYHFRNIYLSPYP